YSRPTPSIDVPRDVNESVSFFEQRGAVGNVLSKPMISFVKETGCPSIPKVINTKNSRKPIVKYPEMYRLRGGKSAAKKKKNPEKSAAKVKDKEEKKKVLFKNFFRISSRRQKVLEDEVFGRILSAKKMKV
ncbi:hypothetical protein Tco_0197251, partial [Tanacetum coccineum]